MWILLKEKLPVKPSPPKLSIFWSTPWPIPGRAVDQRWKYGADPYMTDEAKIEADEYWATTPAFPDEFGRDPNALLARSIWYKRERIRVWAHEFNIMTAEKMRDYVFGMEGEDIPTHELVADSGNPSDERVIAGVLGTDTRLIYESALLDGANHAEALLVALDMDITQPGDIPSIGWYRCKPEFAAYYCTEQEMEE